MTHPRWPEGVPALLVPLVASLSPCPIVGGCLAVKLRAQAPAKGFRCKAG